LVDACLRLCRRLVDACLRLCRRLVDACLRLCRRLVDACLLLDSGLPDGWTLLACSTPAALGFVFGASRAHRLLTWPRQARTVGSMQFQAARPANDEGGI
jgi:hypothetical protein